MAAAALVVLLTSWPGFGLAAPGQAEATAGTPRDTGRHRPVVVTPPPPLEAAPTDTSRNVADGRWQAGFVVGPTDAGSLFHVETASGFTVGWGSSGNQLYAASRFTAKVDPGGGYGLFASRRLGEGPWRLRMELARAACNVAAEALQGQAGEVYRFDRLTFLSAGMAVEARLTSFVSHPYCSLGMTFCRLGADREKDLDQNALGVRGALGYRQRLGDSYLGLEAQLERIAFDFNDFRPTVAAATQPELIYDPGNSLWLTELRLSLSHVW